MLTKGSLHRWPLACAASLWGVLAIGPLLQGLANAEPHRKVQQAAVADFREARGANRGAGGLSEYPIGVFDSGTGGLTVLEQILEIDAFDNQTRLAIHDGDGAPDFQHESFIFLADQANMPYGNYPMVGKESFLDGLILNDARFLLGNRYYGSASGERVSADKLSVKALVIACNTATAYGKVDIEESLRQAGLDIKVIGVVDAGAEGAVQSCANGKSAAIGVLATEGTVLSGAYPAAIRRAAAAKGWRQELAIVQQGALGLAGAIDGAPECIAHGAASHLPRDEYRGPSLSRPDCRIDAAILPRYGFEFSNHAMLYEGPQHDPAVLQLNSVDNYIAYHVTTLLEKVRTSPDAEPLGAIVLGCTHFPFYVDAIRRELQRLYEYQEDGRYVYRPHMAEEIQLVDPAYFTARKLYDCLVRDGRLRRSQGRQPGSTRAEFYITVPAANQPGVAVDGKGWFTYDYKYGRDSGLAGADYRAVPLRPSHLDADGENRLRRQTPTVWRLLQEFRAQNAKLN